MSSPTDIEADHATIALRVDFGMGLLGRCDLYVDGAAAYRLVDYPLTQLVKVPAGHHGLLVRSKRGLTRSNTLLIDLPPGETLSLTVRDNNSVQTRATVFGLFALLWAFGESDFLVLEPTTTNAI